MLGMLARDKHSNLLGKFISKEENKELRIGPPSPENSHKGKVKVNDSDKHSSLLWYGNKMNYSHKKFKGTLARPNPIKILD
jgi:hypothetical protein